MEQQSHKATRWDNPKMNSSWKLSPLGKRNSAIVLGLKGQAPSLRRQSPRRHINLHREQPPSTEWKKNACLFLPAFPLAKTRQGSLGSCAAEMKRNQSDCTQVCAGHQSHPFDTEHLISLSYPYLIAKCNLIYTCLMWGKKKKMFYLVQSPWDVIQAGQGIRSCLRSGNWELVSKVNAPLTHHTKLGRWKGEMTESKSSSGAIPVPCVLRTWEKQYPILFTQDTCHLLYFSIAHDSV
jgi:hypothetical protein